MGLGHLNRVIREVFGGNHWQPRRRAVEKSGRSSQHSAGYIQWHVKVLEAVEIARLILIHRVILLCPQTICLINNMHVIELERGLTDRIKQPLSLKLLHL